MGGREHRARLSPQGVDPLALQSFVFGLSQRDQAVRERELPGMVVTLQLVAPASQVAQDRLAPGGGAMVLDSREATPEDAAEVAHPLPQARGEPGGVLMADV